MSETVQFLKLFYNDNETIYFRSLREDGKKGYIASGQGTIQDFEKGKLFDKASKKKYDPNYLNPLGYAIWFVVNGGGYVAKDVTEIRAYFIDVDFGKTNQKFDSIEALNEAKAQNEASGNFKEFLIEGKTLTSVYNDGIIETNKKNFMTKYRSMLSGATIVETYSGFHCYFVLDQKEGVEDFKKVQLGLAQFFSADTQINNKTRLMRVPGFAHNKYKHKPMIKVVQFAKKKWTKEELIMLFNIDMSDVKKATKGVIEKSIMTKGFDGRLSPITKKEIKEETGIVWNKKKRKSIAQLNFKATIEKIKAHPFADFIKGFDDTEKFSCYFHNDSNPSALIFEGGNGEPVYKCWGCNAGGNIITIYQRDKGTGLKDTVIALAGILGIQIVQEQWQLDEFEKLRMNREFLTDIVMPGFKDSEPGFDRLKKVLVDKNRKNQKIVRRDLMNVMLNWNEKNVIEEEFMLDGNTVFFISVREIVRQVSYATNTSGSLDAIYRSLKLLTLLGFLDVVPLDKVPEKLQKRAIEERKNTQEMLLNEMRKCYGQNFNFTFDISEITFYQIPWFEDRYAQAMERLERMEQKNFKLKQLNKNDIALVFGEKEANRVYPNEMKTKKHERNYEKFKKVVLKEIEEKGFFIAEDIGKYRITKERGKVFSPKDREEFFKRFLPIILTENNLIAISYRSEAKKKKYNYKGKNKSFKVITKKDLS